MYNIFDKLKNYSDSDYYAFHMPGHKRNLDLMDGTSPYRIDITEIDGFDDLHHAEGILKEAKLVTWNNNHTIPIMQKEKATDNNLSSPVFILAQYSILFFIL